MKKTFISIFLVTTLLASSIVFGAEKQVNVVVNGKTIVFADAKPFLDSQNRVQVPVRFVTEALGAKVDYTSAEKVVVTITLDSKEVVLTVGEKSYTVDGVTKQMDTVPTLKSNRTFVPLRFVSEALGATVEWINPTVFINLQTTTELAKATPSNPIVIWSSTNEIEYMLNDYYLKDHPEMAGCIKVVTFDVDKYCNALEEGLAAGIDAPDLFISEQSNIKQFVENPVVQSVDALGISEAELRENQYAYTIDSATDSEGKIKAVSWNVAPGVFVYNKKVAKEYIGSSDPKDVQAAVDNWDKFLETARSINKESGGKVKIVADISDIYLPYMGSSDKAWVYNNTLTIDQNKLAYMDFAKIFIDEKLTHRAPQWNKVWFDAMENDSTLGYFLAPWGVEWVIPKENAAEWAITEGPQSYVWGGAYFAVTKYCDVPGTAADIIRYFTLDEEAVDFYARATRTFVNNTKVISGMIGDEWHTDILGDQNYYSVFDNAAKSIKFENHKYDDAISQEFIVCVDYYVNSIYSKEEAIRYFKEKINLLLSDIKTE